MTLIAHLGHRVELTSWSTAGTSTPRVMQAPTFSTIFQLTWFSPEQGLLDLNVGGVTLHGQDLTDQPLGAHTDHVGHIGVRQARGNHQRSGYFHNFTAQIR